MSGELSISGLAASVPVFRAKGDGVAADTDPVAREISLLLRVGGRDLCRLQCSPDRMEDLAVGFLCGAGFLQTSGSVVPDVSCRMAGRLAVADVALDVPDEAIARFHRNMTAGTGCGLAPFGAESPDPFDCGRKIDTSFRIRKEALRSAMASFQKMSAVYRETGGVHGAAIADGDRIVAFAEDIGRHNAVDKTTGFCLRRGIPLRDKALLSTGRVSLDLVSKAVRAGVPVAASRSAPTDAAVELAALAQLTLIGFLRGDRMNIYSAQWRLS
ncbi:MAG: formate dehydrogenase accessory sulfurtransferase FdhD [Planctomycetota bacterium]|nr:formate dehydrogenase accessory sulfurtransferase FdhD [Planctomycetota bacterium]